METTKGTPKIKEAPGTAVMFSIEGLLPARGRAVVIRLRGR
jgi:hypothetical protein